MTRAIELETKFEPLTVTESGAAPAVAEAGTSGGETAGTGFEGVLQEGNLNDPILVFQPVALVVA